MKSKIIKGSIAISAIVIASYVSHTTGSFNHQKKDLESKKSKLENTENQLQTFDINADADTSIVFDTGSIIQIKKGTFIDSKGLTINGKVQLKYREFHSPSEIILANIPMEYDSSGIKYHFESAGMFEIYATQNNQEIYINPSASIDVQLVSLNSDESKFNKYYLKDKNDKWNYLEKDFPSIIKLNVVDEKEKRNNQNDIPTLIDPSNKQFKIKIPKGKFPELEGYKDLMFEVPKNYVFDLSKTNQRWLDVEIERINNSKLYHFTFLSQTEVYEINAYPVLNSNELLSVSLEEIDANYKAKKNDRKIKFLNDEQNRITSEINYKKAKINYLNLLKKTEGINTESEAIEFLKQAKKEDVENIVYRTFQVKNFGFWNSDCPQNMPQGIEIYASLEKSNGQSVNTTSLFLIEKGKNVVYKYNDLKKFSFNPNAENILIVIQNNQLSWVDSDQFKNIRKSFKSYTFEINTLAKSNFNSSDINELLQ